MPTTDKQEATRVTTSSIDSIIPITTPPSSHPFPTMFFIVLSSISMMFPSWTQFVHTIPGIHRRIFRTLDSYRHFGRQNWSEGNFKAVWEARKLWGSTSQENVLWRDQSSDDENGMSLELTLTRRPFSASVNLIRTFCIISPRPAESTPARLGENHVSQTRQRSVVRWMRALPRRSPSSYTGLKADRSAERWELIAACVCSIVNVGSNCNSFCSTILSWSKSSSSSEDTVVVFFTYKRILVC